MQEKQNKKINWKHPTIAIEISFVASGTEKGRGKFVFAKKNRKFGQQVNVKQQ